MSEITNQDQASNAIKSFSVDISKENYLECIIEKDEKLLEEFENQDRLEFIIKYDESEPYYISQHFKQLPYGLMDKSITGLGATTLEMRAKRHSIIVTPTKNLAYNKYSKDPDNYFYVGSSIGTITENIKFSDIKTYLSRSDLEFKKILVVADSLPKVTDALGSLGIDYTEDYFILIDEIDKFVKDSDYREKLETSFDYYKTFNPKKRAMISATIQDFSSPIMVAEEKTTFIFQQPERKIKVITTKDATTRCQKTIMNILNRDSNAKIFIAFNSVELPVSMANYLTENFDFKKRDFGIACSISRSENGEVEDYFVDLNDTSFNGKLPRQICFTTSTNFVGIDLDDDYHLISVSKISRPHHILSSSELIQIYGRNRKKDGILSDTFIFETEEIKDAQISNDENEENDLPSTPEPKVESFIELKDFYLKYANKMVDFIKTFVEIREFYYTYRKNQGFLSIELTEKDIKSEINKETEKFIKDLNKDICARKTIENNIEVSYFLLDSIVMKKYLQRFVYNKYDNVIQMLTDAKLISDTNEYIKIIDEPNYKTNSSKIEKDIEKCIGYLDEFELIDNRSQYSMAKNYGIRLLIASIEKDAEKNDIINEFYERFIEINFLTQKYFNTAKLLRKEIYISKDKKIDKRKYNKKYNECVFMSLSKTDTFKSVILNLEEGKVYTREEVNSIVQQALSNMGITFSNKNPRALKMSTINFINNFINTKQIAQGKKDRHGNPTEMIKILSYKKCDFDIQENNTINDIRTKLSNTIDESRRLTSPETISARNVWKDFKFESKS